MKRILVIDSEGTGGKQVRSKLEVEGYAVQECDTEREAIALFRAGADAVILSQKEELSVDFWQDLRTVIPVPSVVVVSGTLPDGLEGFKIETLREGAFYVAPQSERPSILEYRLPQQGISFSELEKNVLSQALQLAGGNQTRAASLLGLSRDQIRYRMAKFSLTSSGFQQNPSSHAA